MRLVMQEIKEMRVIPELMARLAPAVVLALLVTLALLVMPVTQEITV